MKRLLLFAVVIGVLGIASVAAGAYMANFAGTWALDKGKSGNLPRNMEGADIVWTVTQDEKTIKVQMAGGMGAQAFNFNLDGSETTAEVGGRMPGTARLKAKWLDDGKILELKTVRQASFQGNDFTLTTTEHWELGEGGKVLKVHRTTDTPRGVQEVSLVFNKK